MTTITVPNTDIEGRIEHPHGGTDGVSLFIPLLMDPQQTTCSTR